MFFRIMGIRWFSRDICYYDFEGLCVASTRNKLKCCSEKPWNSIKAKGSQVLCLSEQIFSSFRKFLSSLQNIVSVSFRNWKLRWPLRNWSSFKKVMGCNDAVEIDVTCYSVTCQQPKYLFLLVGKCIDVFNLFCHFVFLFFLYVSRIIHYIIFPEWN